MLTNVLDIAPRRGLTIIARQDGGPMSYCNMSKIRREERYRLGSIEYDLHARRYSGVMELA